MRERNTTNNLATVIGLEKLPKDQNISPMHLLKPITKPQKLNKELTLLKQS